MASVQSTWASDYARHGVLEDEPSEHVESAGELLIRQLVQKQTNKVITLEQQLLEEKHFERGVGFVSVDELGMGTSSLHQFEERQSHAESIRELESKGLTRAEALELMAGGRQSKATPEAQVTSQQRLEQFFQRKNHTEKVQECVSRRERELALSVKPDSLETRLYQFALKNKSVQSPQQSHPGDHPIHHLQAMEQALQHRPDPLKTAKTVRRKWQQHLAATSQPAGVHYKAPNKNQSLWDSIEPPEEITKKPRLVQICKREALYTIKDGRIVQFEENKASKHAKTEPKCKPTGQAFVAVQPTTEKLDVSGRLSEAEIKKIPRFQNYQRGKESNILYIKNLCANVTETDLTVLFHQFQKENEGKLIFRLMTGKMRGQAFVTFSSCTNATAALNLINGTILKDKPMVIQYGKQMTRFD